MSTAKESKTGRHFEQPAAEEARSPRARAEEHPAPRDGEGRGGREGRQGPRAGRARGPDSVQADDRGGPLETGRKFSAVAESPTHQITSNAEEIKI